MTMTYTPRGVCSRRYDITLEDGVIKDIEIYGGCNGNLSGIRRLIVGRKAEEVISLLRGTTCGPRPTSCPDQISLAREKALEMEKAAV